ncbi:PEPxxWA-CTERM sorting domain-containing protein [Polymorphobacter megasporae]|nr:PEPxxWA-CTERM sorting domain-containing protein [Polymorphobacter megasporae]
MRLELNNNGAFAGSLILEFFYQGQTNPLLDTWNHVAATQTSGIFWTTNAAIGTIFAGANGGQQTLAQWIASKPDAHYEVTGVTIGAGSGWPDGFTGAIDNVQFAFAGGPSKTFDFAAGVPEPAAWGLLIVGFGMVGTAVRRRRAVVFS